MRKIRRKRLLIVIAKLPLPVAFIPFRITTETEAATGCCK
jgi:hypothetical protein